MGGNHGANLLMNSVPLNVNVTARMSLISASFTAVSHWLQKMHQVLREIAVLRVAASRCEGEGREACPALLQLADPGMAWGHL